MDHETLAATVLTSSDVPAPHAPGGRGGGGEDSIMARFGFYKRRTEVCRNAIAYPLPAYDSRTVIIIGCGRGGTTAVSGVVDALGVRMVEVSQPATRINMEDGEFVTAMLDSQPEPDAPLPGALPAHRQGNRPPQCRLHRLGLEGSVGGSLPGGSDPSGSQPAGAVRRPQHLRHRHVAPRCRGRFLRNRLRPKPASATSGNGSSPPSSACQRCSSATSGPWPTAKPSSPR